MRFIEIRMLLAARQFGILPRRNWRSCPSHDLPTVPERRLLSVPPKLRIGPSVHRAGTAALALPFLRLAISRFGGGLRVLGLRALPALRELRLGAHFRRPRRQRHPAHFEKMACVPRLQVRPLPPAILQRSAVPAHRARDHTGCASQGPHDLGSGRPAPQVLVFASEKQPLKAVTQN